MNVLKISNTIRFGRVLFHVILSQLTYIELQTYVFKDDLQDACL